jgi:hypothetical protein
MRRNWFAVVIAVSLAACTGDQGEQGPEGPEGPPGEGFSDYTYQGNYGEACNHCHATTVDNVLVTNHSMAYDDLGDSQTNLYCLQCHTTGFDSYVAYGDTAIADENRGPDIHGYDDYVGVEGEEAAERRLALEAVQCESCHGPMGPSFNAHQPDISFSTQTDTVAGTSESLCYKCHHTQIEEWVESGHANAEGGDPEALTDHFGRSSCWGCHTSEGFIANNDPRYATYEFGDVYHQIGCPTCHDPHKGEAGEGNYAQLRNVSEQEVQYTYPYETGDPDVPTMDGYGPAQTCVQCHHARRDTDNVQNQVQNGYPYFGPHRSNQMDMFIGAGSYEIAGRTYDRDHAHQTNDTGCVNCHMTRETELHGEIQEHPFHTWEPTVDNCVPCHTGIPDFNVNGAQDTIQAKLDSLAVLFGYTDFHNMEENWDSTDPSVTVWQREAAYAAFFIYDDGSLGLHNPKYANSLLDNAIAYADSIFGLP